jgi:hypothetical protein
MTTFPNSPRLMKGALTVLDPANQQPKRIVFQYNPDTMTRRLDARSTGGNEWSDKSEAFRLTGAPLETYTLTIELDATDQLEKGEPSSVYPALSALELLLYPTSEKVIADTALALAGNIEIIPPEAPLTIFEWGVQRVLPVRLTGFSITEEAFDTELNPIRARVDLSLRVLSYTDLKISNPGYSMFLAHHIAKENLAGQRQRPLRNSQNIRVSIPRF